VIELARHAEAIGADGVCVVAPYYWPLPPAALEAHFDAVLGAIGIGFVGYHSPAFQAGVGFTAPMLKRLVERHSHFIGLKEASHNFETFIELRRAAREARPNFAMFLGVEYLLPSITLGGVGAMSVFGGIAPRLVRSLYDAAERLDMDEARRLQDKASVLWQLMKPEYPAPIKAGMEIMGRPVGGTRRPMRSLDSEQKAALKRDLEGLDILDTEPHGW
jgi:dihydrodipicolinate synthase/N-acetylneuraminate lyase